MSIDVTGLLVQCFYCCRPHSYQSRVVDHREILPYLSQSKHRQALAGQRSSQNTPAIFAATGVHLQSPSRGCIIDTHDGNLRCSVFRGNRQRSEPQSCEHSMSGFSDQCFFVCGNLTRSSRSSQHVGTRSH